MSPRNPIATGLILVLSLMNSDQNVQVCDATNAQW